MMAPHWLDTPFEAGNGDYNATWNSVVQHPRFLSAIQKADEAFRQAVKFQQTNQESGLHVESGSPSQYARVAFLHEINQDDVDRSGYAASAPPVPAR